MKQPDGGFGRRGQSPGTTLGYGARMNPGLARREIDLAAAQSTVDAADADAIAESAGPVRLLGEILAFLGMAASVFIGALAPIDPHSLQALGGNIFIPELLFGALDFETPRSVTTRIIESVASSRMEGSLEIAFIAMGLAAVATRRFLLAGLITGFFAFPWAAFGFPIANAPTIVTIMAIALGFRWLAPKGWRLALFAAASAVLAPFLLQIASAPLNIASTPRNGTAFTYRIVRASELFKQNDRATGGPRITTLADLVVAGPQQESAKAFVLAQEYALAGKGPEARSALDAARSGNRNSFELRRLSVVESWATVSGQFGDDAKAEILGDFRSKRNVNWALGLLAVLVGIGGFLLDRIAITVRQRSRRMKAAIAARNLKTAGASRPAGFAGPAAAASVDDGEQALENMAKRIGVYAFVALSGGAMFVTFAYAWWRFQLPDANAYDAFHDVGLTAGLLTMALDNGWIAGQEVYGSSWLELLSMPLALLGWINMLSPAIAVAAYLGLQRRFGPVARWSLPILLGWVLIGQIGREAPDFAMTWTIPSEKISFLDRSALESLASRDGGAKSMDENIASQAAFVLAQIAYVENRPDGILKNMGALTEKRGLRSDAASWRLAALRESEFAHGGPGENEATDRIGRESLDRIRSAGHWGATLAGFSALVVAMAFAAIALAFARYRRIDGLIEARRMASFSTPVAS